MHQYRFKCIARKFQPYLNKHGAVVFKKTGCCRFYSRRSRGWSRLTWPKKLLYQAQEERGCCFGSKSAILEAVGLLIPLIAFLDFIASKQLVFKVDNSELMWGQQSGYMKNGKSASDTLIVVHYLGEFLGATIFV